jgi:hypothetical protein
LVEDRTLLSTFLVNTAADSGPGSLRQAILDSNAATSFTNTIDFDIPGQGVQTIAPLSPLPAITQSVLIDGSSQPGYAGASLIDLSGSQAGGGDGLTITGPGVTVRGLDINGFSWGAGVLISGAGATGDSIQSNLIGTDPSGTQALPNYFGVEIVVGASGNRVGGTTAEDGNLIAFNYGAGVEVDGASSVANQITSNRIFGNDAFGGLKFDGSSYVSLPNDLIRGSEQEETIEATFETTSGGVILGYQGSSADSAGQPAGWVSALYVGTDGRLYGDIYQLSQAVSNVAVNDGAWHTVALVNDGATQTLSLYLDGQLVGSGTGSINDFGGSFNQIGTGYSDYWAATPGGWYGFVGQIDNVRIWSTARSAAQVAQDMTTALSLTEPGLEAGYTFNEGQGLTVHDLTANHNDGTLAGINGDLPTWTPGAGLAIDLGGNGLTYNSATPRQGPNNLPNFPFIVPTADGHFAGWLGGGVPDTTFRIDVFASSAYAGDGSGQAQEYLGSLEVTTDSTGQAVFDVPFTPPADKPFVTATATDRQGNTSEVSALRRPVVQVPAQPVRLAAGRTAVFSTAAGDAINLGDPDAGPLDAAWDLTLSVPVGTLSLPSTDGLAGSGNGTATLNYRGSLSTLDADLQGLSFAAPLGFDGNTTVTLSARSNGAAALQAQFTITDGVFSVATSADSGPGSLRQAILDSDVATGGTNTIGFAIAGTGLQVISPASPLPPITSSVLIDGFSQPGYAGTPLIEIDGQSSGSGDGLTITGSGTTVRGLDIVNFASGAGIVIDGSGASGNVIVANVIGADPSGATPLPDGVGIRIADGAQDNTVGGTDPSLGNLIVFDLGSGVVVDGNGSVGNRLIGNRIFSNSNVMALTPSGTLQLGGYDYLALPNDLIRTYESAETIEASFRTTSGGVILGYQGSPADSAGQPAGWVPALYVGTDGRLYGDIWQLSQAVSNVVVNDGQWHNVALMVDGAAGTLSLYLDGQLVRSGSGSINDFGGRFNQIGTGYTDGWAAAPGGWYPFVGQIDDVQIWSVARSADQIQADMASPPTGPEPGLVASYPFDEGGGSTAHDESGNHLDGTVASSSQAIDLGGDGVTYNAPAPRQGPNNLQNYPVVVTTAGGHLQGWLGGSEPDASYHVEIFASSSYAADGSGEAEEQLGSLEVTTDSTGQAVFDVPFSPPADKPFVTATATDSEGNTSEVTAQRRTAVQAPMQIVRRVPGQPAIFSATSGNVIALQDPDAGPLDPVWNLALSTTNGTLTLAETSGLTGSGNRTGTLDYVGALSALDAAVEGLRFTPALGYHGNSTLTLDAESPGATAIVAQVTITDGVFVVTSTADSGAGSLREAILDSNVTTGGTNTIDFTIAGTGLQAISPASPLPAITNPVTLDGTIQPGFAGAPLVSLRPTSPGSTGPLIISGSDVTIRGVATDSVTIDATSNADLIAEVHPQGATAQLALLDPQGQVVVQSDGLSAADQDAVIHEAVGSGNYSLVLRSAGAPAAYTWTTILAPAAPPFQQLPVGVQPDAIVAADFTANGRTDLAVVDNGYHCCGASDPGGVSVLLSNADGTFQPQATYAMNMPYAIVAGDFTGNGRTDLAVADSNGIEMLLGNGDGSFQPAYTVAAGISGPVVAGDFNGDGHVDLGVADGAGVQILLGNGDGSFQPAYTVASGIGGALVAGDFNGDGKLDLAAADGNGVHVLIGNGDGTFQPQVGYAVGNNLKAIVAGDFNGDGQLDLAVVNGGAYNCPCSVSVLLGKGDGTFGAQITYAVGVAWGGGADGIVAGDFAGNGRTDLAVTNYYGNTVSVLLANGDGTFQPQVTYSAGPNLPLAIAAGDFSGNGRIDLAVVNAGTFYYYSASSGTVSVLLGNGDGTFQPLSGAQNRVGSGPDALVAGDFNGDGRTDLAVANQEDNTVSVVLGNGDGTFQPEFTYTVGSYPAAIVAGDFNGDGRVDLAVANSRDGTVSVLLGNGDGTFQPQVTYRVGSGPDAIVAGDFNGDGHIDLGVADGAGVQILLGNGDGSFQSAYTVASGIGGALVAADFNGDGRLDLAVAGGNAVSVLLGNGDGTFRPQVSYAVGWSPIAIAAGDFTGDGHLDLAVANNNDNTVSVLLGNGDGTFQPQVTYWVGSGPGSIAAGDFTGNGHLDLAVANSYDNTVSVLLGNGDGTFQPQVTCPVGSSPMAIAAGDFTGNGRIDVAVANYGDNTVSALVGSGDGTFVAPSQLAVAPRATPLVADVNGDGTDDVLVVNSAGNILYRQGIPGQPGTFEPPITVNPQNPSHDIAWVPNSSLGPLIASVDAHDAHVSLYAYRAGGFVQVGSLNTGPLPAQIVAADLDHSGWTDLIVRDAADGTLSVFFNDGTGTFQTGFGPSGPFLAPVTIPVGIGISDVAAVDTTGAGTYDLVVTNKLTGQVSVLRNLSARRFAPPVPYRAGTGLSEIDPGNTPEVTTLEATSGVAAGPLTPGGPTSLVALNPGSYTLGVLAGLGGGRFANPVTTDTASPAQVVRMADFTGNGIQDLAVLTSTGLSIYLGGGKGNFSPPKTYAVPPEADGLTVADLIGNGKLDLLVGNAYGDVLVLLGNGDGTFQPYHQANRSIELAVADLTGKGSKDIIYADQGLDRVVVDYGAGNSTVLGSQSTGLLAPGAVTLADLNGDGIPDLIVANSGSNNVLIYPGLGNGQFGPAVNGGHGFFTGTNPVGITAANLTGKLPDLVVANKGSDDVSILLNQGNFNFTQGPRLKSGGTGPVSTVVGHFTGSPYPDILVTNSGSNDVALLPGVGGGFFNDTNPQTFAVGNNPGPMFVGNFDGKPDLVTVNAGSNDLTLISNFMSADATTSTIASGGTDPATAFAFSASSGFEDLVVGNGGDGALALFEGGPQGLSLSSTEFNPDLPSPSSLAFTGVAGGQVQFFAATEGREAAILVALSLTGTSGTSTAASTITPAIPETVAQLVPLSESSLALVGTLLVVTIESPAGELSEATGQTGTAAVASASAAAVALGQSVAGRDARGMDGSGEDIPDQSGQPQSSSAGPTRAWERFVLGTDEALEQYEREHSKPSAPPSPPAGTPETNPEGAHSDKQGPAPQDAPPARSTSTQQDSAPALIDRAIELLGDPRRVGETHQNEINQNDIDEEPNCIRIGPVGFTHPTERYDISAALALAATVAGNFYFGSVSNRGKARRRWASSCGMLGRGNLFRET